MIAIDSIDESRFMINFMCYSCSNDTYMHNYNMNILKQTVNFM